jgi:hypothetical protein
VESNRPPDHVFEVFRRADGRVLDPHELTAYGRAGLAPVDAVRWADAGIGPYSAEGYVRAGLGLEDACRWRDAGITGDEAPTRPRAELDALADEIRERLDPYASTIREHALRGSDLRRLLDDGVDGAAAVAWLAGGGPEADAAAWIRSGFAPADAAAWHDAGIRVEDVDDWRAEGMDAASARSWRQVRPDEVKAWTALGFDAKKAARWISKGLTPGAAEKAQAGGDRTDIAVALAPEPYEPEFDPDMPFAAEDLAGLKRPPLEQILRDHFDATPEPGANIRQLREQIVALQHRPRRQGVIRWVDYGDEDAVLYRPSSARRGRQIVELASSMETWRDVRKALRRRGSIAGPIRDYLVWQWESDPERLVGDALEEDVFGSIGSFDELLAAMPADASCEIELMTGDGEARIVDWMDPLAMGVPPLIIDRYYVNQSNMVSHWTTVPIERLDAVRRTLKALGWRLESGNDDEIRWL